MKPRTDGPERCSWAIDNPLLRDYHDREWGVPVHDDRKFFEFLVLEGAQAGLSWLTILGRRENYRKAFRGFNPRIVARFGSSEIRKLLHDEGIIRNNLKIRSAVSNAKAFLAVQREFGSFDVYVWRFAPKRSGRRDESSSRRIPGRTRDSDALSRDLNRRGFRFVGSTICYAFMQATGLVNDHARGCFRRTQLG